MKKVLALFLVVCMIAASSVLLSSCGGMKLKDIEENPALALSEVMTNTTGDFFADPLGMNAIMAEASKGGSISVLFESDSLLGDVTSIKETLYMNGKDKEIVSDTVVKYDGQELSGRIFANKDGVLFNSESVLGSDKTLALNFASFEADYKDSALAQLLGFTGEGVENTAEGVLLNSIKSMYESLFTLPENATDDAYAQANEFYALLNQTVSEAKVETADGEVKCIVVSYTLNNETLKAFLDKCFEIYSEQLEAMMGDAADEDIVSIPEMKQSFEEAFKEINDNSDIALTLNVNIDKKAAMLVSTTLTGDITAKNPEEGEAEKATVDGKITFSDTKIAMDFDVVCGEESIDADFTVTKSEDKGVTTYDAIVNASVTEDGETVGGEVVKAKYTYNKENGEFEFTATVTADGEETDIGFEGTAKADKNSATVEITSVTMDDFSVKIKLAFTFNKTAEIPARPTDAKDVAALTEDELMVIMQEIMESPFGQIMSEMGGDYEDDGYYDEGYYDPAA